MICLPGLKVQNVYFDLKTSNPDGICLPTP